MKRTLALVSTVGLITFCIFNMLHQQTKTIPTVPSDTISIHKTTVPLKKANEEELDIYAKNIAKLIASPDKDKTLNEIVQKEPTLQKVKAKDKAELYSKSYSFIKKLAKEAANLSHKLLQ